MASLRWWSQLPRHRATSSLLWYHFRRTLCKWKPTTSSPLLLLVWRCLFNDCGLTLLTTVYRNFAYSLIYNSGMYLCACSSSLSPGWDDFAPPSGYWPALPHIQSVKTRYTCLSLLPTFSVIQWSIADEKSPSQCTRAEHVTKQFITGLHTFVLCSQSFPSFSLLFILFNLPPDLHLPPFHLLVSVNL